jgi:hypothetical protein
MPDDYADKFGPNACQDSQIQTLQLKQLIQEKRLLELEQKHLDHVAATEFVVEIATVFRWVKFIVITASLVSGLFVAATQLKWL